QADDRGEGAAGQHTEPRSESELEEQHGRRVRADPHEHRVAEGQLAGETAQDVPGIAEVREHQNLDQHVDEVRREDGREQCGGPGRHDERHDRLARRHAARLPRMPSGLNRSMRMKIRNGSTGPVEPGMKSAPSASATATTKLASSAPTKFPMPPRTTTTKAIR